MTLCSWVMAPASEGNWYVADGTPTPLRHGPGVQPSTPGHAFVRLAAPPDDLWLPPSPRSDGHRPGLFTTNYPLPAPFPIPNVGAPVVIGLPDVGGSNPPTAGQAPPTVVASIPPTVGTPPAITPIPTVGDPLRPPVVHPPLESFAPVVSAAPQVSSGPGPVVFSPLPSVGGPPGGGLPPILSPVFGPAVGTPTPPAIPEPAGILWLIVGASLLHRRRTCA